MKKTPKLCVLGLCGRSVFMQLEHFHRPEETLHAQAIHIEPGGKGYNQAVAAARMGAEVTFLGCCGRDEDAEACRAFLETEGIKPVLEYREDRSTALAVILTDAKGENRVTVYAGAGALLSAGHIRAHESEIASSDMLLLNLEYPMETNLAAAEIAQGHGVPVLLNLAPGKEGIEELLPLVQICTPNRSELRFLPGAVPGKMKETAGNLRTGGPDTVIVTMGGDGALLLHCGHSWHFPAIKCSPIDTTGAGDCFNGALAASLAGGMGLSDAVVLAQNAAALSVGKRYVMPSLPGKRQVEENFCSIEPEEI